MNFMKRRMVQGGVFFKSLYTISCGTMKKEWPLGRDVAQAVSRWIPTAAARVRVRASCGICGGQSGTGAGFLRVLRFPLPIIIPPISPSSYSPGAGKICLLVAAVPSGPNWTRPPTIPIYKKKIMAPWKEA
jgi:hypothetical protein